jgi:hypothetical protein
MKFRSLATGILLFSAAQSAAQSAAAPPGATQLNITPPGITLEQVVNNARSFLNPSDTLEGGGNDMIDFFTTFWQGRVALNDSSGINMFEQYHSHLRSALQNRMSGTVGCPTTGFRGNWSPVGPDSLEKQTIGKIDAIWADPADSNYILAGATGGLFKTTDGGKHWACITDGTTANYFLAKTTTTQ